MEEKYIGLWRNGNEFGLTVEAGMTVEHVNEILEKHNHHPLSPDEENLVTKVSRSLKRKVSETKKIEKEEPILVNKETEKKPSFLNTILRKNDE